MQKPHSRPTEQGSLQHATEAVHDQTQKKNPTVRERFHRFSQLASAAVGSPWAFVIAALVVIVWGVTGRMFNYSDTWQLVINTGTTIVTFLMVFLIQNTQNRDAKAIHLKLDELIRSKRERANALLDLENCTDEELEKIEKEFRRLRKRAAVHRAAGEPDQDVMHVDVSGTR